ncbi:MAG: DUF2281 domain-containing protein [Comamonadaceae bacterium]|nr:DUF2281 domain-containing protein [Burkholderiales bacterium]MEB2347455.1 DUF2281 domain-containing protein [Comamonadaceae bacterium]
MNLATRIYDKALSLPQQAASEVLHFAEFLAARHAKPAAQQAAKQDAGAFYARYQADLSGYRFDRDEANAR